MTNVKRRLLLVASAAFVAVAARPTPWNTMNPTRPRDIV